jgi:glycerophosphoryl diester phosphodiesterase
MSGAAPGDTRASRWLCALAALSVVASCRKAPPAPPRDNADLPRAFGHAFGAIDGNDYTNSLEAFRLTYGQGCRFFEADLWITPDHHQVFFHDGKEAYLGLSPRFTWDDFMNARLRGKYTPLDADAVAGLFAEKTDWLLLADVKSDERESLTRLCDAMQKRGVDCRKRIVPHIFNLESDYQTADSMGFPRMILALYRLRASEEEWMAFVRSHPKVVAVNIPVERFSEHLASSLNELNVRPYFHTVNDPAQMRRLVEEGAWGFISDTGCPSADALLASAGAGK